MSSLECAQQMYNSMDVKWCVHLSPFHYLSIHTERTEIRIEMYVVCLAIIIVGTGTSCVFIIIVIRSELPSRRYSSLAHTYTPTLAFLHVAQYHCLLSTADYVIPAIQYHVYSLSIVHTCGYQLISCSCLPTQHFYNVHVHKAYYVYFRLLLHEGMYWVALDNYLKNSTCCKYTIWGGMHQPPWLAFCKTPAHTVWRQTLASPCMHQYR